MSARRSILFVHQNFPGQFGRLADALRARGDRVAAIGSNTARGMPGVDVRRWTNSRGTTEGIYSGAVRAEADLIRAAAAARTAAALAADGFSPDVIIGHPGWGETLHLKEVWPQARMILLGEYWYTSRGGDVGFDPEFTPQARALGLDDAVALNARNVGHALAYVLADTIICPTPFQASTFPPSLRERIVVHHEGIDIDKARRRPNARVKLPGGKVLDADVPVVTFISRTLEPLRGFHSFMRALPPLLAACPEVEVVIIGEDKSAGYGAEAPPGHSWKSWMLAEIGAKLDASRVHFIGRVPHADMIAILSIARAHVYLTYPFVLSWSLLEAMACGCLVIGSDTAPLHDVIRAGDNGLLVDFFDPDALAARIEQAVRHPALFESMRKAARHTAESLFDARTVGIPRWLDIIDAR